MKRNFIWIVFIFSALSINALMENAYKSGKSSFGPPILLRQKAFESVPGYQAKSKKPSLKNDDQKLLENDGIKDLLVESDFKAEAQIKEHDLDKENDLYRMDKKITEDPLKILGGGGVKVIDEVQATPIQKTCEEGVSFEIKTRVALNYLPPRREEIETVLTIDYPNYLKNVGGRNDEIAPWSVHTKNKQVDIKRFRKHACPHFTPIDALTKQRYKIDCFRIKNFSMVQVVDSDRVIIKDKYGVEKNPVKLIQIKYLHDTYQSDTGGSESWGFRTPHFEEIISKHNCVLITERCMDSRPRKIEELTVHRPCFEKELTYKCSPSSSNGCDHLQAQGCTLESAKCVESHQGICVKYQKTYRCLENIKVIKTMSQNKELPFCFGGDCHESQIQEDQDFHEVISKLGILDEMQKDIKVNGGVPTVFRGDSISCNRHLANFKDCCQTCKGWGVSLGLGGCGPEEKTLSERRQKGQCHYVGTYCAEKIPLTGVCLRQKSVFCCFGSKLARIFQEQGRIKAGKSWGDAKSPNCSGFMVEELQRLDFRDVDLSELYTDMFKGFNPKSTLKGSFKARIPELQKRAKIGDLHAL